MTVRRLLVFLDAVGIIILVILIIVALFFCNSIVRQKIICCSFIILVFFSFRLHDRAFRVSSRSQVQVPGANHVLKKILKPVSFVMSYYFLILFSYLTYTHTRSHSLFNNRFMESSFGLNIWSYYLRLYEYIVPVYVRYLCAHQREIRRKVGNV